MVVRRIEIKLLVGSVGEGVVKMVVKDGSVSGGSEMGVKIGGVSGGEGGGKVE